MGLPIARVGDTVFCPADYHIGSTPVPTTGFIQVGSSNTFTNNLANAIADSSKVSSHALCIGPNTFHISSGSPVVFTNNFPQARSGDSTQHCGSAAPGQPGFIIPTCSLDSYA